MILTVVVGCGGVAYQSAQWMRLLNRFKERTWMFIDPDRVVNTNWGRQWPESSVGAPKCKLMATAVLGEYTGPRRIEVDTTFWGAKPNILQGVDPRYMSCAKEVEFFVWPDNHKARLEVEEFGLELVDKYGLWVSGVTAGCGPDYARAYKLDLRHPDPNRYCLWSPGLKNEPEAKAVTHSCGTAPNVDQTVMSNVMASCLSKLMWSKPQVLDAPSEKAKGWVVSAVWDGKRVYESREEVLGD